jgi:hypothetical protein
VLGVVLDDLLICGTARNLRRGLTELPGDCSQRGLDFAFNFRNERRKRARL